MLVGILAGLATFLVLPFVVALLGGVGTVELALIAGVAVLVGVLVARSHRRRTTAG